MNTLKTLFSLFFKNRVRKTKTPISSLELEDFKVGDVVNGPKTTGFISNIGLDSTNSVWIAVRWNNGNSSELPWCDFRKVYLTGDTVEVFWN